MTNAEKIRTMSDEELAGFLNTFDMGLFCQNLLKCIDMSNAEAEIPIDACSACALAWLRRPAGGGDANA